MHLEVVVQAHAAAFLGRTAWDIRGHADLLVDAHRTAWACYRHRTLSPGNDALTLEAEAWGAVVQPTLIGDSWIVVKPIMATLAEAATLPDLTCADGTPFSPVLRAVEQLAAQTTACICVPVTGPLALAERLIGREALVRDLHDDPFGSREHLLALARKLRPWISAIAERGARVSIIDDYFCTRDVEPEIFSGLVVPALAYLVNEVGSITGVKPVLSVGGDISAVAYKLFSTNAGTVVCPAAARRSRFFQQAMEFPDTTVRLDMPPELWTGSDWPAICRELAAARAAARHHPNTLLGTGTLPVDASSVLVVDASHFTASLDDWMEPEG